jgi:hypothetical protein
VPLLPDALGSRRQHASRNRIGESIKDRLLLIIARLDIRPTERILNEYIDAILQFLPKIGDRM